MRLAGKLWRDEYEVCRDKSAKWSRDGRTWQNFSAWNPESSAVCWYDVAMIHRTPRSKTFRKLLLNSAGLPTKFCDALERDRWYPKWIDEPPPSQLCCTHAVLEPQRGQVCHTFKNCSAASAHGFKHAGKGGGGGGGGKGSGGGKGGGGKAKPAKALKVPMKVNQAKHVGGAKLGGGAKAKAANKGVSW